MEGIRQQNQKKSCGKGGRKGRTGRRKIGKEGAGGRREEGKREEGGKDMQRK